MRDTSLVYPVRDGKILLGRKRRGMGCGKWNGFGGKIESGETMRECAARELREECGLLARPEDLAAAADFYFHQPSDPSWSHAGLVYFVYRWEGTPRCSDEMEPVWFPLDALPFDQMWEADRIWLPILLSGERLRGTIYFDEDGDHVTGTGFEPAGRVPGMGVPGKESSFGKDR